MRKVHTCDFGDECRLGRSQRSSIAGLGQGAQARVREVGQAMTKKAVCGLDLVRFRWDYEKTPEENIEAYREAYRAVYGEYPPPPSDDEEEEVRPRPQSR